jgi:hypothetical protein
MRLTSTIQTRYANQLAQPGAFCAFFAPFCEKAYPNKFFWVREAKVLLTCSLTNDIIYDK